MDLQKFMSKNTASYYPNALCFEDLREISLFINWFGITYKSILITIEQCKNTILFPNKCEYPEDIEDWLAKQVFYVVA